MAAPETHRPSPGAELIMVQIGEQRFAIDITSVREIRGWAPCTPLPHAPAYVHGMINLRGVILPVIDLGARLGLAGTTPSAASVVVVAEIHGRQVGLLVDAVCDILLLKENMLQDPPEVGVAAVREFVQGVMAIDSGIVSLLGLEEVLPPGVVPLDALAA
jgi:purine-binding chemotaxis protein CheW